MPVIFRKPNRGAGLAFILLGLCWLIFGVAQYLMSGQFFIGLFGMVAFFGLASADCLPQIRVWQAGIVRLTAFAVFLVVGIFTVILLWQ